MWADTLISHTVLVRWVDSQQTFVISGAGFYSPDDLPRGRIKDLGSGVCQGVWGMDVLHWGQRAKPW